MALMPLKIASAENVSRVMPFSVAMRALVYEYGPGPTVSESAGQAAMQI